MRIVDTTAGLGALCTELAREPYVALDTEFMRDQTYWPKLCLLQAANPETAAIIDPLAHGLDLAPLYALLTDKSVVKVFHAARQDVEIFFHKGSVIPEPMFDTQIAAMVCGFGEAASYEMLVRRITKAEVDKSARFTDWSRRPLTQRQLEYAISDVTHLCNVYEYLSRELDRADRRSWLDEEEAVLADPQTYRLAPEHAWRRLRMRSANRRFIGVAVALAAWREQEAQKLDVPRNRVLKDEALLEIAAHPPSDAEALGHIRALPRGYGASRQGRLLLAAVKHGLETPPPEDAVAREARRRGKEPSPAALDLLKTLLRLRCNEYGVAPRLVAGTEDLERLAAGDDDGVAALRGWRAEVFGNDARRLREGKLAIALHNGEAVIIEKTAEPLAQRTHAKAR
ncbi:MAG: ribonuclease D [Alphaproteobacteria bacterium]